MATSKFFANPGSPQSAVNYLLDEIHNPEVLRGNPQSFLDLANSIDFKNQYTSGVIRTTETMTDEQMNFIMNEYTQFLTAGLNDPAEVLWVKHYEHEQTELHFVIPNIDLESGRAFQPYAHKRDLERRDALDNIINAKFDFHDPDDPANQQFTASDKDYLRTSKDRKGLAEAVDKAISDSLVTTIKNGGVYDRKSLISDLQSLGFEVKERGKNISIKNDAMAKPMRLKGSFYEPTARFDSESFRTIEQASEKYRESRTERLKANESEYRRLTSERIAKVENRYSQSWKAKQEKLVADADIAIVSDVSTSTDTLLSDNSDSRESKRTLSATNADRQLQSSKQDSDKESKKRSFLKNSSGHETELQLQGSVQNPVIVCVFKGREIGKIIDKGNKLTAHDFKSDKAAAYNIVKNAKEKGWESINLHGNKKFVTEAMRMALNNGLKVTAKDEAQQKWLDSIIEERKENDRVRENAFRTVEKARTGTSTATQANEDYQRRKPDFTQQIKQLDKAYGERVMQRNDELEKFKTDINIVDYAQDLGFEVVKKESTKKSIKMKNGSDTLIISTGPDGHGIYFNATSNKSGSIIDLAQEFKNLNLGQVRKELRPFIGRDINARTEREHYTPKPLKSSKDAMAVANEFAKTEPLMTHPYLSKRGISEHVQASAKFQGKFRIDERQNVVFPHFKGREVVGFEKKNQGFTGFSSGGEKALWYTNDLMKSEKIVIVESAIDAMSFEQLHGKAKNYGYISIGGQPNHEQLQALAKLDASKLVLALDNDSGGESIKKQIEAVAGDLEQVKPQSKDFNEDLVQKQKQERRHEQSYSQSM